MSAKKSKSTKELLAAAKLPERSVEICLRGDLVADINDLERELAEVLQREATDKRMTGPKRSKELADAIEAKRAEMSEAMLPLRLRALKVATWRELVRKYPPAKGDDTGLGVDIPAFMGEAIPASVVSPDDMDEDDWETFNENVPPSEVTRLMNLVWELNTQGVDIPKSRLVSVANRRNGDG